MPRYRESKSPIREALRASVYTILAILVALLCWTWGASKTKRAEFPNFSLQSNETSARQSKTGTKQFRVSGASMVPTFFGPWTQATCGTCNSKHRVSPEFPSVSLDQRVCTLCGGTLTGLDTDPEVGDLATIRGLEGDQAKSVRRGDIVAIDFEGKPRLKRIAGRPGDRITLAKNRILINGRRLEDLLGTSKSRNLKWPRINVYRDTPILSSRFEQLRPSEQRQVTEADSSHRKPDDSEWHRNATGAWVSSTNSQSNWLVYHHRSVHDHKRVSPIHDDYQFNVGISRHLNPVDRLAIGMTVDSSDPVRVEIVFWSEQGPRSAIQSASKNQHLDFSFWNSKPVERDCVTDQNPIAIRVNKGCEIDSIRVERFIEYRIRRTDPRKDYPMELGADEWFVVGDNVPASEDSRVWGPIKSDQIFGILISSP